MEKSHESPPQKSPEFDAIDSESNGLLHRLEGHTQNVRCVASDLSGRRFASIAYEADSMAGAELILWNKSKPKRLFHTAVAQCLVMSQDGKLVAASDLDGTVHVRDFDTGEESFHYKTESAEVTCLDFSSDSRLLAVSTLDRVHVLDMDSGTLKYVLQPSSHTLTCVAFSPDNRRLATTGIDEGSVDLWDTATGENVFTLRPLTMARPNSYAYFGRVVFSPDGRRIAVNSWSGVITVWITGSSFAEELTNAE